MQIDSNSGARFVADGISGTPYGSRHQRDSEWLAASAGLRVADSIGGILRR